MIKVEAAVPLPAMWSGGPGRPSLYPWLSMDIGDSFFVSGKKIKSMSAQVAMRRRISPWRYTCRTIDGGVRVWRTA